MGSSLRMLCVLTVTWTFVTLNICLALANEPCVYNTTHCQCAQAEEDSVCLRYQSGHGESAICIADKCDDPGYRCDCSGRLLCPLAKCMPQWQPAGPGPLVIGDVYHCEKHVLAPISTTTGQGANAEENGITETLCVGNPEGDQLPSPTPSPFGHLCNHAAGVCCSQNCYICGAPGCEKSTSRIFKRSMAKNCCRTEIIQSGRICGVHSVPCILPNSTETYGSPSPEHPSPDETTIAKPTGVYDKYSDKHLEISDLKSSTNSSTPSAHSSPSPPSSPQLSQTLDLSQTPSTSTTSSAADNQHTSPSPGQLSTMSPSLPCPSISESPFVNESKTDLDSQHSSSNSSNPSISETPSPSHSPVIFVISTSSPSASSISSVSQIQSSTQSESPNVSITSSPSSCPTPSPTASPLPTESLSPTFSLSSSQNLTSTLSSTATSTPTSSENETSGMSTTSEHDSQPSLSLNETHFLILSNTSLKPSEMNLSTRSAVKNNNTSLGMAFQNITIHPFPSGFIGSNCNLEHGVCCDHSCSTCSQDHCWNNKEGNFDLNIAMKCCSYYIYPQKRDCMKDAPPCILPGYTLPTKSPVASPSPSQSGLPTTPSQETPNPSRTSNLSGKVVASPVVSVAILEEESENEYVLCNEPKGVCCDKSCKICGELGCGNDDSGRFDLTIANECCAEYINAQGRTCAENYIDELPCILNKTELEYDQNSKENVYGKRCDEDLGICCHSSCAMCGGLHCGNDASGKFQEEIAGNCCSRHIKKANISCDSAPPPCIIPAAHYSSR